MSHLGSNSWCDFECHQNSHMVNHCNEFANQWLVFNCNYHIQLLHGLITLDKLHKTLTIKDNMLHQVIMAVTWKCKVKAWKGGQFDYHTYNFFGVHTNIKFKAIFKINIVNFLIIHVVIDFNGNHHKIFGWILRRLWICNGLLKWQHYICYMEKMKNVNSKICQSNVKKIKINKVPSNEEFIDEMHWNFLYIYIYSSEWCDCCKFLTLKVHFTVKILNFCMDFFDQSHV